MTGLLAAMVPVILLGASSLTPDAPFRGQAREATSSEIMDMVCESTLVAGKGYHTPPLTVLSATFAKARRHPLWIISMRGNEATVMHGQGTVRRFLIKKRDPHLLMLVDIEKDPPVHVITIDPRNSSFVYLMRDVTPMSNQAKTFVGRCRPASP